MDQPNPIVVCGLGRMGQRVLDYLHSAGMPVVVIDTQAKPDDPRLQGARLIQGDCRRREVLEKAGVATARGVLILTADDLLNVSTALMIRGINREVRIVLRMFNQNLLSRLGKAVHNVFALSTSMLTAPILAMTALTGQSLGGFRVDESAEGRRQLVEVTVTASSPLLNQRLGTISAQRNLAVLAHLAAAGDDRFLIEVDPEVRLAVGDRVIVCGEPRALEPLVQDSEGQEQLRWANWIWRMARVGWRTLAELDVAVLGCTAVLLAVVLSSMLVLHFGVKKYSIPTALLRTVSIMATGDRLHEEDYKDSPKLLVFVSTLRIIGAVLMAAFTAIVTNYLLRARLGGALEVRRIPESGHIIVCGLSSVGFRVVEELIRYGERVVVIEQDASNRFVPTARRLGAAVMIGDGGVIEVLRQAHAATARAVVPATNNDMTNLEVALLVRELNTEQRVVLLLNDPQFAQMLRDAAGINLAVSVPALAAPAFVAGLFGDRVNSLFYIREALFGVIDLVINEQDPFIGLTVRTIAVDYRFFPVALVRGRIAPQQTLLASRLEAGDRLVGIIALGDLERLLRRQPSSAAFAVDVLACPLPTRAWLMGMIRMTTGGTIEEAEQMLTTLPLRLASGLTRGQAEELLAQLSRERVGARLCPVE